MQSSKINIQREASLETVKGRDWGTLGIFSVVRRRVGHHLGPLRRPVSHCPSGGAETGIEARVKEDQPVSPAS